MTARPIFSVIIPTCSRAQLIGRTIESVLRQRADEIPFEIIVVDNNSHDATPAVVHRYVVAAGDGQARYLFEPRQGVSHARNLGIEHAHGDFLVFLDDDLEATAGWLRGFKRAFDEHPEIDCVGGYVRPRLPEHAPAWLTTPEFTGPIAARQKSTAAPVDREHATQCLGAGNFACRRQVFDEVGRFSPDFPRSQDRELELRLWRAGKRGLYLPEIEVIADVESERMTPGFHRRWYAQNGRTHAHMWYRDLVDRDGVLRNKRSGRSLFGTPLFIYRELLGHLTGWIASALQCRFDRCLFHETRIWYDVSFVWTRLWQDLQKYPPPDQPPSTHG